MKTVYGSLCILGESSTSPGGIYGISPSDFRNGVSNNWFKKRRGMDPTKINA